MGKQESILVKSRGHTLRLLWMGRWVLAARGLEREEWKSNLPSGPTSWPPILAAPARSWQHASGPLNLFPCP